MNWSNLPFHITEKIIKYAAQCPNECNRPCCGHSSFLTGLGKRNWMKCVHTYGQVCRGWKDVIFHSKIMFDNDEKSSIFISFGNQVEPTEQELHQIIADGYLELTTEMSLHALEKDCEGKTLQLVREFAGESSMKSLEVIWDTDQRNDDNFSILINILKESKMIEHFAFCKHIYGQRDFKVFWERLIAVFQIEKIKTIQLNICWFDVDDTAAIEFISAYPDILLQHINKIQVNLWATVSADVDANYDREVDFNYGRSDENLTLSDFTKKFRGTYSM